MYRLAVCVLLSALLPNILSIDWYQAFVVAGFCYICSGGWKWIIIAYHVVPRDLKLIMCFVKLLKFNKRAVKNNMRFCNILVDRARKSPDKVAYISVDTESRLTYKEANELANKIAHCFYDKGFRKGDVVALIMENRVEYVPIWIGLSKIGVITALINTNLCGDSLKRCIEKGEAKAVLYTILFENVIKNIHDTERQYFCFGGDSSLDGVISLKHFLEVALVVEPPPCNVSIADTMIYIYTSGTTGNPKPAVIPGIKGLSLGQGFSYLNSFTENEIIYNTLPLYHTSGGVCMAGGALLQGATFVIRKKFSASKFFEDCCKYDCTFFIYIGEICRYLLAQPAGKFDKVHKIRQCTGNGLRASIWKEFQERFQIPKILEFYGSTEGSAGLFNLNGHVGAVGYISPLIPSLLNMKLVKMNPDSGHLLRDNNGLAVEVSTGEVGYLVTPIIRTGNITSYSGYVDKSASEKKIVHDVVSKGDSFFLSGDMFVQDKYGYFYFKDRYGDTFRWKGENVSTNEVEGIISKVLNLNDVCVYGVEVPGTEGKAGMACIVDPERKIDLGSFHGSLIDNLPVYARPLFLRFSKEIPVTGTFKIQKLTLAKQGFNPAKCSKADDLYYFDSNKKEYLPFDEKCYENVLNHQIRF